MKIQLTEQKLNDLCEQNGVPATRENRVFMAFFNDAEFRESITRLMFERAVRTAKDKAYSK